MHGVLPFRRMSEAASYMDAKVLDYLNDGQIETFESFEEFDIIAFDWYDVRSDRTENFQILIYLDREDLFFFCEDEAAQARASEIVEELQRGTPDNEQMLYRFFVRLLKGDMAHLDQLEAEINDGESAILTAARPEELERIAAWRRELLRLKRYYEQLDSIFDEMAANDNGLLSKGSVRRLVVLSSRTDRYLSAVQNLREAVTQMREAYQSQLSIQQNDLMKIFTVVTVVFLPLTLLAGWYGMNFTNMPELQWKYGYPAVIGVSAALVVWLIWYFKRKKWL